MEIKNVFKFDVKVTTVVDHSNPNCEIAVDGVPSPTLLRPGETMVILSLHPGVSFNFERIEIKDANSLRHQLRRAHDDIMIRQ